MTTTVTVTVRSDDAVFSIVEHVPEKAAPYTQNDAVRSAVARATKRARDAYGVTS